MPRVDLALTAPIVRSAKVMQVEGLFDVQALRQKIVLGNEADCRVRRTVGDVA